MSVYIQYRLLTMLKLPVKPVNMPERSPKRRLPNRGTLKKLSTRLRRVIELLSCRPRKKDIHQDEQHEQPVIPNLVASTATMWTDVFTFGDIEVKANGICDDCNRLDLRDIYNCSKTDHTPEQFGQKAWPIGLKHQATCPLCAFFASYLPSDQRDEHEFMLHAAVLSASFYWPEERFPDFDTVMMWVECPSRATQTIGPGHTTLIMPTRCSKTEADPSITQTCTHVKGREVQPVPVNYQAIAEWLKVCTEGHPGCVDIHPWTEQYRDIPGFRLIDVTTRSIIPAHEATDRQYVTLSYVWGDVSYPALSPNMTILPDKLPTVIEHALTVTKNLGFKYIWIDRYCIPRDDSGAMHTQIQLMGKIYSRSTLTIIGAAGTDADYGLPGVTDSRPQLPQARISIHDGQLRLSMFHFAIFDIMLSRWNSRGWTYQEAILPKRRLVFTDRQVYFQCQEMHVTDHLHLTQGLLHTLGPWQGIRQGSAFPATVEWEDNETIWTRIGEYGKRYLSYDYDALNAITGVLAKFRAPNRRNGRVRMLCGLPLLDLLDPLLSHPINTNLTTATAPGSPKPDDQELSLTPRSRLHHDEFCSEQDGPLVELISALLWSDEWESRPPVVASTRESRASPRRQGFPSWTWAGWRHTEHHRVEYFPPLNSVYMSRCGRMSDFLRCDIQVAFNTETNSSNQATAVIKEKPLDWSQASEDVLKLTDKGMIPTCLVIKGKVFDVELRHSSTADDSRTDMSTSKTSDEMLTAEEKEEQELGGIKRAETSMMEYTLSSNNETGGKKKPQDTSTANGNNTTTTTTNSNITTADSGVWTFTSPPSLAGIIQHVPPAILPEDQVHKLIGLLLIATNNDRYFEFLLLRPVDEGYYERITNVTIAWNGTEFNPVLMDPDKKGRLWTPALKESREGTEGENIGLLGVRDGVVRVW